MAATVLATPLLLAASPNHGHPSGHDPAKDAAKLSRQLVRASSGKDAYRHLQQFQAIADSERIPTGGVTQADGERLVADLAKGDEVTVSFEIREFQEPRTTRNVIAETRGGNAARAGRSDYGPFIDVGIPAGGTDTGAEVIKSPAQAEKFGGEAGIAFDPCYHSACDTLANIDMAFFDAHIDVIANAVGTYAYDLRSLTRPVPPAATVGQAGSGGGLREGHSDAPDRL
ncbi:M28 family peptidase [Streptomyces sp. NPDC057582]|uniref:M28 family peptidase n=1 Tax=Streptomyces sp. NPDC057582 TaxID=3346174 RepID=UPI0036CCAD64